MHDKRTPLTRWLQGALAVVFAVGTVLYARSHLNQAHSRPEFVRVNTAQTAVQTMSPEQLAREIAQGTSPAILNVGSVAAYRQHHIRGAIYGGDISTTAGKAQLAREIRKVPLRKPLVIYCGCCPWGDCPNVSVAHEVAAATRKGETRILRIETNFKADWIERGFPTEPS